MTQCNGWVDFMVAFMARSVAVAGAVAVGVLSQAVISEPAQAQAYAFGNTQSLTDPSEYYATLDLYDGTTLVATLSTSSPLTPYAFQGFISDSDTSVIPSVGGPYGTNTSYTAGAYNGALQVDYFGFNLAAVPSTVTSVTSATLVLESGLVPANVTYTLFGATQWISDLETTADQNATLYANLVKGVSTNPYGSFQIAENTASPLAQLMFTLNAAAVSNINQVIADKAKFALAGEAEVTVPEPSTWVMMLAGFAGLGFVAHRRAARRRATTSAG